MPTPAKTTFCPSGLTLAAHAAVALKLRHVIRDLQDLRAIVHAALGAREAYEAASDALGQARRLSLCLSEALPPTGSGDAAQLRELRELYLGPEEAAGRGHGSSLMGSALIPVHGRQPVREGT